jgi:hypothetical protein
MPNDQLQSAESVQSRLTAFFGGEPAPTSAPEADNPPVPHSGIETVPEPEQPSLAEASDEVTEQSNDETAEVPTEEIDWDGEKYAIPAKLKPAFMMQADYTRKTQELAEVRRSIEAEKLAIQSAQLFTEQTQPLLTQKQQLNSMKEQAKKIDWTALTTDQKIDLDRELRNIDGQLADIDKQLSSKQQEHEAGFGRAVLQAVQATEAYMAQKVPGWNQNAGNALHDYGTALGIPKQKLTAGWFADPVATHVMWKAQQWDNLQAGKPAVANKASKAVPVVKAASAAASQSNTAAKERSLRERLHKTGNVNDAAALLLHRMR